MYQVLLVDDETIILSGIKFLIDWEKQNCNITGSARNGRDALEKIRNHPPDIVFCDIKMPVMDGMELLQIVNEEFPSVVFIMLTNFQEFSLAREALRLHAVDYLLKAQLEANALIKSLSNAKKEFDNRAKLFKSESLARYLDVKNKELLQDACLTLIFETDQKAFLAASGILQNHHMLSGYSFLYLPFDLSEMPDALLFNQKDRRQIQDWIRELAQRISEQIFGEQALFVATGQTDCLILFIWGQKEKAPASIALFQKKLSATLSKIVQAKCLTINTGLYYGEQQLLSCREELLSIIECYYLGIEPDTEQPKRPDFKPLGLSGIGDRLFAEINCHNVTGAVLLLEKAEESIRSTIHQKSQAIWLCGELFRAVGKAINKEQESTMGFHEIDNLMTRQQVLFWLEKTKKYLKEMMCQNPLGYSEPVEKAKQYIEEHVEEHIRLQEVADYAAISPAYLSSLFKKQSGQSFIDFVNQKKIEKAQQLIHEGNYRINEIAYQLSFENAYYFTKVFRKFTGTTPSNYQKKYCKNDQ